MFAFYDGFVRSWTKLVPKDLLHKMYNEKQEARLTALPGTLVLDDWIIACVEIVEQANPLGRSGSENSDAIATDYLHCRR
ncbi:MAG: hypothetical protein GYB67_01535 [Chloroflexi bacterium]|nr:hypothetical protein [Chloroflexota bacterium]